MFKYRAPPWPAKAVRSGRFRQFTNLGSCQQEEEEYVLKKRGRIEPHASKALLGDRER